MSWRIDDHPQGGLQITHLVAPRFTARWATGDFPIEAVQEGAFFWTDEGSGQEDSIHLYDFVWRDPPETGALLASLLLEAIVQIDSFIGID